MVAPECPSSEASYPTTAGCSPEDEESFSEDRRRHLSESPSCGKRSRQGSPNEFQQSKEYLAVKSRDEEVGRTLLTEAEGPSTKIARSSPVLEQEEQPSTAKQLQECVEVGESNAHQDCDSKPPAKHKLKEDAQKRMPLPLADNLREYMRKPHNFRPRPEWYMISDQAAYAQQRRFGRPSNPTNTAQGHLSMQWPPLVPPGLMVQPDYPDMCLDDTQQSDTLPFAQSILDIPPNNNNNNEEAMRTTPLLSTFGRDFDPALHVTIRESATEAAIGLLHWGSPIDSQNAKGVTPLILASQKGNTTLVKELLRRGAMPSQASVNGTTAVLQAAHFGHMDCLELLFRAGGVSLMEMANFNHTTPLMRAAQEGHVHVVEDLLDRGASVNRRNRVNMTALMLASQRGHAKVCEVLVKHGAELDSMTSQHSTSLLLACKRGHKDVVRVLVEAGAELWAKDSRGRCAREVAQRRDMKDLIPLIDSNVQLDLMQRHQRRQRNYDLVRLWNLLQQERALVSLQSCAEEGSRTGRQMMTIHQISHELSRKPLLSMSPLRSNLPPLLDKSTQALLRTMSLPAPLLENIATYIRLPLMWERRIGMLTKRSVINADATVQCALDLIDEILEEGGFVEACDYAQVVPPTHFASWRDWKLYCRLKCRTGGFVPLPDDHPRERPVATSATVPTAKFPCSVVEMRRQVGCLQVLANRPVLAAVLEQKPFKMPRSVVQQLMTTSDIQSLVRRMGSRGVHFESTVAMDLVMLVSRLCSWYSREREDKPCPFPSSSTRPQLAQNRCRALPMRVPLDIVHSPFEYASREDVSYGKRPPAPHPGL